MQHPSAQHTCNVGTSATLCRCLEGQEQDATKLCHDSCRLLTRSERVTHASPVALRQKSQEGRLLQLPTGGREGGQP